MQGGCLLSCWQVDETEIRRQMTLLIQVETVGRADQKKMAERRKAKYRSQDLSGAEKQKGTGEAQIHISSAVNTRTRRELLKAAEAASIPAPRCTWLGTT